MLASCAPFLSELLTLTVISCVLDTTWAKKHSLLTATSRTEMFIPCFVQIAAFIGFAQWDSHCYRKWQESQKQNCAKLALIVPVLNEVHNVDSLHNWLQRLQPQPSEVIFVDGGSTDGCATDRFEAWLLHCLLMLPHMRCTALPHLEPQSSENLIRQFVCRTEAALQERGCTVISSDKGRATQMNAGAQAADSPLLCFVHADTRCCTDVVDVVRCAAGLV